MNRFWSFLFLLVPIGGVATFVAAPYFNIWLPRDISEHGRTIDSLFMFILYLTGAVFIVTEMVLFWFSWKYDAKSNEEPVKFSHGSHALELVWTILPAVTLLFIAIYQMEAWAAAKMDAPDIPITVEVTGRQFNWDFRYPGPDDELYTEDDMVRTDGKLYLASQRRSAAEDHQCRRLAQLLFAEPTDEARRGARHGSTDVVQGKEDWRLRHRVCRAVRLGTLQDEGPRLLFAA